MRFAIFLNLIIPGSGLIALGREWLGLALAALFGVCAHIAIAGSLIVPDTFPKGLTLTSAIIALVTWVAAQWTLRQKCAQRVESGGAQPKIP